VNIRTKLILAFTFIALISAIVGSVSIIITRRVANDFKQITEVTNPQLVALGEIKAEGLGVAISSLEFSLIESAGLHAPGEQPVIYQTHLNNLDMRLAEYQALIRTDQERQIAAEIVQLVDNLRTTSEGLLRAAQRGVNIAEDADALAMIADLETFESTLVERLNDAIALQTAELQARNRAAEDSASLATFINILAMLVTITSAVVLGVVISENIANPLDRLKRAANLVGEGRRDVHVVVRSGDELGVLAQAFNTMVEDLRATTVSRDYVDSIIQSTPGALIVLGPSTEIVTVNPAAEALLNYSEAELVGQPMQSILADERLDAMMDTLSLSRVEETFYRARDGHVIPVSFTSSIMQLRDGTSGVVTVALDITERKQAEAERERLIDQLAAVNQELAMKNHELAEANRMKSQFMATVSHELRTPLSTIIGQSGVILAGMVGDVPERLENKLQSIYDSAQHLLALINDILDIERIESGQMKPNAESISLSSLAKIWHDRHIDAAMAKQLDYEVLIDPNLPRRVIGDQKLLTQVATNLIGNAIKYTETGRVEVDVRWWNNALVISVLDTGPGIPANELDLIFDEFHRSEAARKNGSEGTGLGLAITRRLVRGMGGKITVRSKLGEGSRFVVVLPLQVDLNGAA